MARALRKKQRRWDRHLRIAGPAIGLALLLLATVAPTAGASYAYVLNSESANVSVIDTATNRVVGAAIPVGAHPSDIAITPDGKRAYVTSGPYGVSVIDTETNQVAGPPIALAEQPTRIAITPDGGTAYMTDVFSTNVSTLDLQLNREVGPPISVASEASGVVISPDGKTAYILHGSAGKTAITVLDIWTNRVVTSFPLPMNPTDIAITPDGKALYVTGAYTDGSLIGIWRINTETDEVTGPIPVPAPPSALAIGGRRAYALAGGSVYVIDTTANEVAGSQIPVGYDASNLALSPNGQSLYVTSYFADSVTAIDTATRKVVGSPIPVGTAPYGIAVAEDLPSVRVGCPPGGPEGCKLSIQALAGRRGGARQSTVTNVKLRSKRPRLVPLRPRHGFAARIAKARKLLVKETVEVGGKQRTTYRRLKVFRTSHPGER
jgi:YVTN family beta-propeller protein